VVKSLPDGAVVIGSPAVPQMLYARVQGLLKKLPDLFQRVRKLEKKLAVTDEND
jgi:UDP-3-O-[3-hydroxymyristoyl] glucosamine N-acyltransferase